MFEIIIDYLPEDEELEVIRSTTSLRDYQFEHAMSGADIRAYQQLVRKVPVSEVVLRYALNLVRTSRPGGVNPPDFVKNWLAYGASVRAAQYLILGGKARALARGRYHVSFEDIQALARPVLRHRLLRNFHAESERVSTDDVITKLLETVAKPASGL
jgi:MoxR-like ATPase